MKSRVVFYLCAPFGIRKAGSRWRKGKLVLRMGSNPHRWE